MPQITFSSYPLWANLLIFAAAAGLVWFAGVRLERYADAISRHTGRSHAFVGMVLLAPATSLPEIATASSAALLGNNELVVHNLTGAVVTQLFILAIADWLTRHRGALTFFSPQVVLVFQGIGLIALLMLTIIGMVIGLISPVRALVFWPVIILVGYLLVAYLMYRLEGIPQWLPLNLPTVLLGEEDRVDTHQTAATLTIAALRFTVAALLVLAGGWTLAHTADAIAVQSGLGASFIGVTLLALATSLPEFSTTLAASRSGRYALAVSNIFGSNAFNIMLLFVGQLFYRNGALLADVRPTAIFVAALGALFACIYLWGLLEREDRTVYRIGWDSAAVSVLYIAGLAVLYYMR